MKQAAETAAEPCITVFLFVQNKLYMARFSHTAGWAVAVSKI